jgi:nicotinate-nucleotide adenylyltransferase
VDTLRELLAEMGEVRLTLLLGADQLSMLHGWKGIGEILEMAGVAILPRMSGAAADFSSVRAHLGEAAAGRLEAGVLGTPLVGISATEVRARVRAGLSVRGWVPEAVEGFIQERGLYR